MENIYDKSATNYNNASEVKRRKIDRARKYSKAAITLSLISLLYIAILIFMIIFMPTVSLFGIMRVVVLVAFVLNKIFLFALPIFAVLFGIFGFQEKENELRIPALILSIASIIVVNIIIFVVGIFVLADMINAFFESFTNGSW